MDIRNARADDAPGLAVLCGQLGYEIAPPVLLERLGALARADGRALLVAEGPRGLAGLVEIELRDMLVAGPFAEIAGLVVEEGARCSGVGRALMDAAERWARSRGIGVVRLRSNVIRAGAHAFYQRLGYELRKTQHAFQKQLPETT